ncbi:unnamed protein product [Callosobruchus maculatus]|uniref:Androgen-dependent TFPI-regulating protein n=1 Tax=Callosobruchus maculatus TaxID=64391 RepID=A0A653DNH8_CALMS|nr:unnamed protein product [Callosobruchus maculatus]
MNKLWNSCNTFNEHIKNNHGKKKILRNLDLAVSKIVFPLHFLNFVAEVYAAVVTQERVEWISSLAIEGKSSPMLTNLWNNRFLYFTVWNFTLQLIFLGLAVCHELSELLKLNLSVRKKLGRARAVIFDTFTFPCTLLTVTVFWTVWHIDRELIFPRELSKVFPDWLNHMLHTFILVPVIVEILAPKKHNFVDYKVAARSLFLFALIYQLVYLYVYMLHGVWLYPIHEYLSWTGKIILFTSKIVALMAFQKIGISFQHRKKKMHNKVK